MERRLSSICEDGRFDMVMEKVGYSGLFQKRFNIILNFLLVTMASMPYLNIILALAVPDHWCHVPGIENTSFSLEEWKNITLPKEFDTRGRESASKCQMYNASLEDFVSYSGERDNLQIVECQHGWDFDKTWYTETAPSEGEWVCDKELYVNNAFASGRIGDVVGTFIFGQLGDTIGRRPVFFITLITLIFGRCLSAFTWHNYPVFTFSIILGSLTSTAVFQSSLIVAMEISDETRRAHIALLQNLGWTSAMCLMPLIFWACGHWFPFMLITTLPCVLFLFSCSLMVESPRWLASRGKITRCIQVLKKIAKTNGTKVPEDAMSILRTRKELEKAYGVMSLFSSWRLAVNSVLLLICWINSALIYYVIILNVNALGGNPFLNFFWQGAAEFPAYIVARIACDKIGRRWTQVFPYFLCGFASIPLGLLITDPSMQTYTSALAAFIKFSVSFVFYVCTLQTIEMYPTSVRQSGFALASISSSAFGILGPYIVFLGTAYDASYPFIILAFLSFLGGLCASFLPETLHQKLPETLADAQIFGANQKYFSLPQKPDKDKLEAP